MPLIGPKPKPGDLIEFHRVAYQHWGVYVGNEYIVHLTDQEGWSNFSSALEGTAVVRKERLESVADGCNYNVNNKYDSKCSPYPARKIVNAALQEVGKRKDYSVTSANCEHFATHLRYGKQLCDQVDNAVMYAAGGAAIAAAGILAVVAISSMRSNRQKQ
ncbi:phospholipase A and acyltransferase 2-like [Rana temporaria]|uniref:phospholipase A and acyltransferase 2-like n=1 Tax=Rana temporaria TaxID=8407 RepID=UPI001AADFE19|nr:phospholipase A and acyltransferase 2-like [Rana temporaria]